MIYSNMAWTYFQYFSIQVFEGVEYSTYIQSLTYVHSFRHLCFPVRIVGAASKSCCKRSCFPRSLGDGNGGPLKVRKRPRRFVCCWLLWHGSQNLVMYNAKWNALAFWRHGNLCNGGNTRNLQCFRISLWNQDQVGPGHHVAFLWLVGQDSPDWGSPDRVRRINIFYTIFVLSIRSISINIMSELSHQRHKWTLNSSFFPSWSDAQQCPAFSQDLPRAVSHSFTMAVRLCSTSRDGRTWPWNVYSCASDIWRWNPRQLDGTGMEHGYDWYLGGYCTCGYIGYCTSPVGSIRW